MGHRMIYYYELDGEGCGEIYAEEDAMAIASLFQQFKQELLCIYKENDTEFIMVYEKV